MHEKLVEVAGRYVARCRLGGDQRPTETLLRELVELPLATRLAGELLKRSWRP